MANKLIFCFTLIAFSFYIAGLSFAQEKKKVPDEQTPVEERDTGDSLIENIGELPGKIITFPFILLFKGVSKTSRAVDFGGVVLRVTDWLTNEDGTRKVRPIFTPTSGGGLVFVQDNFLKNGMRFRAAGTFGMRTRTLMYGGLRDQQLFSSKFGLQVEGFYQRQPDEDFFGIGNHSLKKNETNYLHEESNVEIALLASPLNKVKVSAGFSYSKVKIKDGRDSSTPSLLAETKLNDETIPGLFGAQMATFLFQIYRDTRNRTGNPTTGGEEFFSYEQAMEIAGSELGYIKYTIPHQHRRELRGYKVIAAWLNNSDSKATNTLDMFVTEDDRSYIRHYIIDFGTSLGSSGYGLAGRGRGHHGAFDLGNMLLRILTLGLWVEPWEKEPRMISSAVGYFESRLFNPGNYAFITPVPAFQRATNLDGFWGAKIVMSFTNEQIRAIVETGEYTNKKDEDYIIKTLIERRDKTGRYWYSKVNPLDNFRLNENGNNHYTIDFDDLAVKAGFETASQTFYRYRLEYQGKALTDYVISKGKPSMSLNSEMSQVFEKKLSEKVSIQQKDKILTFKIQTRRGENKSLGNSIKVHFYYPLGNEKAAHIIALEREN